MELPDIDTVQSASEARELAIDWQEWAGRQSLYMSELATYQAYFEELAAKFDLTEEFKEEGII